MRMLAGGLFGAAAFILSTAVAFGQATAELGRIQTQTGSPRILQFGVKYGF